VKGKVPCAYCSMKAEFACDFSTKMTMPNLKEVTIQCLIPMCRKHVNNRIVDGRDLCRGHRH